MNVESVALSRAVSRVLDDLCREDDVLSIWLFGSRANGTATDTSDWDLLVFRTREPEVVADVREKTVDVLWVGPSKTDALLEGQPNGLKFDFSSFNWVLESTDQATYLGMDFLAHESGQVLDAETPSVCRKKLRAIRLWPNGTSREVGWP